MIRKRFYSMEPNNDLDMYHICQLWKNWNPGHAERIYLEVILQVVWIACSQDLRLPSIGKL